MSDRSMKVAASALAIVLGLTGVGAIGFSEGAIAQSVEDKKKEADRLLQQGVKQYRSGQREAALQSLEKALALRRSIQDRNGEAYVLMNFGNVYQENPTQYEKAIFYYEQAYPIFQQVNDRAGEADLMFNLGRVYRYSAQPEKAVSYYKQSSLIYQKLQDYKGNAASLMNLGDIYESQAQDQQAIRAYEEAYLIYQQNNDPHAVANVLLSLGIVHASSSQYEKAINYYNQSLEISRKIGNHWNESTALSNLGNTYSLLGRYAEAIESLEKSLVIKREINDQQGLGNALGNLGLTYKALGNYAKAAEYLEQTLTISRELKVRVQEGRTRQNLGDIYRLLGNYAKAIAYSEESLKINRELNDRLGESYSLMGLGSIYQDSGNFAKAISYQEQSLEIIREMQDRPGEATIMANLGLIFSDYGFHPQAIDYLKQSLKIAREISDPERESRLLTDIANILDEYLAGYEETMGKYRQPELAIAFYKQSINISQNIRQDIKNLPRETQEIYTASIARSYRNLANLLLNQGRSREAQMILELLKVQENQSYEKDLKKKSTVQVSLHSLESHVVQIFEEKITTHLDLSNENLAKIAQPLTQNRDRIIQEMNAMPIEIGNPNKLLNAKPNSLLIQNLVVGDKLWTIWTNAKGQTKSIAQNITQKELTETVQSLRENLSTPSSRLKTLQALSQKLYNWIIPSELQTELAENPNRHLFFSLDHVTRYVPIAALYDGQQYLIQKHTISNLITTDTDMSDRFSDRPANILALGTSKAHLDFSALPSVELELNAIVKTQNSDKGIFPGIIQLNEAFTANSLRTANPHRVLHIATHGSFNPKTINASYLLLGNGDKLPITEIANLTTLSDKHLVVLSACETGLSGNSPDGTEISGISSYFLRRGAKSVLASLWLVNDPGTALLMHDFYQKLANSPLTKAEALRQAQLAFLKGDRTADNFSDITRQGQRTIKRELPDNALAHPYFWAPFVLVGNSQ